MTGVQTESAAEKNAAAYAQTVVNEAPGYAVEDFKYPHADRILTEQGILLKRGDGHITLAACANGTGQLEIYSQSSSKVCFNVTGDAGWLTLEIPSVYGVRTNGYEAEFGLTVDTKTTSVDVPADSWQGVGQSADPQGRPHMLVEIKTSK
ncbi:hypothetical protein [Streptomyces sp. NPDC002328]|uniref:hypothetical protein n=1 Tax=Streptomyces sp. NPDC002328 TaxID=3364642 RepID=UPI00367C6785